MSGIPRILIAAPSSGTGKTTVTLALLAALKARGLNPVSFKCGPDYIDPMFHRAVLGIPSYNLDLFFTPAETVRYLLGTHSLDHGAAVIEGVMGYYDGSGTGTESSSYALARVTETPALLVISARGAYLSLAATIKGFKDFRPDSQIAGVILNDCSKGLFESVKNMLEKETGLPVLGHLPRMTDCSIGSRHLGLVTAQEIEDLQEKLLKLGAAAEKYIDIDALLTLAALAPVVTGPCPYVCCSPVDAKPRIAVAQDEAFCFYYADNLALLEQFGAELVPFSPLHDKSLPNNIHGLYLGGGYPELYTEKLSQNKTMMTAIKCAAGDGLPLFAECGGFLYLHETLEDAQGQDFSMVGLIKGRGFKTTSLQRFGYNRLTVQTDNVMCNVGMTIPGHEFHYWDTTAPGADALAAKTDGRQWPCVYATPSMFAGFPHLYFYGNPAFAENFVKSASCFASHKSASEKNETN